MSRRSSTPTASLFGAFNARWLSPEQVAKTFVPTPQFSELLQTQSSLLLGPRGCGKTTLLKMLTREAQDVWRARVARQASLNLRYPRPDFEALYLPSDIRWSSELQTIERLVKDESVIERAQRAMVAIATVFELSTAFEVFLGKERTRGQKLVEQLLDAWRWAPTVPSFPQIRQELLKAASTIRGALVRGESEKVTQYLDHLPASFTSHCLDAPIAACHLVDDLVGRNARPNHWALCFDELEIAPQWLQEELLRSFRSIDQRFLLKLTWSPVLPEALLTRQQPKGDFAPIRLWHSHPIDARPFCTEFTRRLLKDRLRNTSVTAEDVLGHSVFAAEERLGAGTDVYAKGGYVWKAIVALAEREASFRSFLIGQGLDPTNPITNNIKERDECLRKIKPLVLLRETFLGAGKARSRKRPALYAGEEAIYAMCDGNPRWLAGILNDLIDGLPSQVNRRKRPLLARPRQAQLLAAVSTRMAAYIRSYPRVGPHPRTASHIDLYTLLEHIAGAMRAQLLGPRFIGDPAGSFVVDQNVAPTIIDQLDRGLLIGAFVFIGRSTGDVPATLQGARLRLSFMLVPQFQLLFRNYRAMDLSRALAGLRDPRQEDLFLDRAGGRDE